MKKVTQKYIICNYVLLLIIFIFSACSPRMAYYQCENDAYFCLMPSKNERTKSVEEITSVIALDPPEILKAKKAISNFFDKSEDKVSYPYSKDWDGDVDYLLAKIAMAEAELNNIYVKAAVISVVLNRAYSKDFPDSVYDVIFEKNSNGLYQFSPVGNGRWDKVEPNEECYKAIELVELSQYDFSQGALYFEDCLSDSWHSRNLQLLFELDGMRFYK